MLDVWYKSVNFGGVEARNLLEETVGVGVPRRALRGDVEEGAIVVCDHVRHLHRKVDVRLHGKDNSDSHGARPVY